MRAIQWRCGHETDDQERFLEEEAEITRPPWIKFFYANWFSATTRMDPEQRGWYIQLLTYAAEHGDPPGYLPNDDIELRQIAGFLDTPEYITHLMEQGVVVPNDVLAIIAEARRKKWQRVLNKFHPSTRIPGLLYNRRLRREVETAIHGQKMRIKAGKQRQRLNRPTKLLKRKGIAANARESDDSTGKPLGTNDVVANAIAPGIAGTETSTVTYSEQKGKEHMLEHPPLLSSPLIKEGTLPLTVQRQEASTQTGPSTVRGDVRGRRTPETVFNEKKFEVTADMRAWVKEHYPEFAEGDITYLKLKFALVYTGKRYASWKRAWYNFVNNQVVNYGYRPGAFNWRSQKQGNGGQASVQEVKDRLRREIAEEEVQASGGGAAGQDSTGLPLDF